MPMTQPEFDAFVRKEIEVSARIAKRAKMQADPDWQNYLKISAEAGYLIKQENSLMTPAPFYPIKR
jgi:hypothetical protein